LRQWPETLPPQLHKLASYQGLTYALFIPGCTSSCFRDPSSFVFAVSRDGLRTWRRVDAALTTEPDRFAYAFWLAPAPPGLRAPTETREGFSGRLSRSTDGGASWAPLPIPSTPFTNAYLVQAPVAGEPWHICGLHGLLTNDYPAVTNVVTCTADGGTTWVERRSPH